MDKQPPHRQHLLSVAHVPFQAWRTLALHYHSLGKSVHWSARDRFEVHYRHATTSDSPEPPLYSEAQPASATTACNSISVREWSVRRNAEPKLLPLVSFATHAMLALRALLVDAFAAPNKHGSPLGWPMFLRLLVFRITVQQHSRPWRSECREGTEEYAVAALHQLVACLLYDQQSASSEWTQGAAPLWLQYHAEYEHTQKALAVLMKSKKHWHRRPVQLARAPLELCNNVRVRLTNNCGGGAAVASSHATTTAATIDVQIYVHPYQLSLAIYAVLSQAVHLIYVAQHECHSDEAYHRSSANNPCTMCQSQWSVGDASVSQTTHALYERLAMMLRSSGASTSNINLLTSSGSMSSDQSYYVCNTMCHWCVLLRIMCLAVMRQLQVRKLVRQSQGLSTLPADDNYLCATVALRVHLQRYGAEYSSNSGARQHQQCTWHALPIEPMLQQALRCFHNAALFLQQYHTLSWYKTATASVPSLPLRHRLWRVRNRVARIAPMCHGGAAQTLALYKTLQNLWWIGAWIVLPRVLCAMERYVCDFLTHQQACGLTDCEHALRHYTQEQDGVIEAYFSREQFARTVSYCISLACRYYDMHARAGWSDAPMRVDENVADQYAQHQPLLVLYATLEALLTCTTRPIGEERWLSSVPLRAATEPNDSRTSFNLASSSSKAPFLGPAMRHNAQCQVIRELKTLYSVEHNTTHYQQQSLLQWWVVPYNAEFTYSVVEDEHQCTLGDLQYTCRVATSICAKRATTTNAPPSNGVSTMVDKTEADLSVQLDTYNSMASMAVVHTLSAEAIWRAFSSVDACKEHMDIGSSQRATLCSELLAAIPTCPPSSQHYAVICGTPEALPLLRELNDKRTGTIQCARDICTMPDVRDCTPVPEYLHFIHDLLFGSDKQLARAAQWLYTRLFYEPRARDQSVEREGDLASLCVQEGDAALRFVRLLPMLLESVVASNPEQSAESVFTALVVPYREAGALRQGYMQRHRPSATEMDANVVEMCWTEESSQSSVDDSNSSNNTSPHQEAVAMDVIGDGEGRASSTGRTGRRTSSSNDTKDMRVMNLAQCSLYSNLLALLAPYHMRVGVSYHTLQQVWCALLDNRELWITHYQLACAMIEWLRPSRPRTRSHAQSADGGIPTWYVWRVMRAAYVRWRSEEQKRKCPLSHNGHPCYREQKLTGIPSSGRWIDRYEFTVSSSAAPLTTPNQQQRRLSSRLKRSPVATSWCLCRQCAQVSCAQPIPGWVRQRPSSSVPGFWYVNAALRYEPELLRMVHDHAYVNVREYATGPARNTGVYCNVDGNGGGGGGGDESYPPLSTPPLSAAPSEPLVVYDPLCPVPPYPDSPEDIQQWKECSFQPASSSAAGIWDTDVAHIPSCSQLMPDMQPPHLLFYAFACDPSVSVELRAEISKSVRAWRGFCRHEMRPARSAAQHATDVGKEEEEDVTNTSVSSPVESFCAGAEQAHEWCQEQARQFCKMSAKSDFRECYEAALSADEVDHYNDALRWMGSGLQPLTFEQLLRNRLMPLETVTHLALFSDILARLPFYKSETPEVAEQLIQRHLRDGGSVRQIPRNVSRATFTHESMSTLYDPSIIHAALLNLCYKGQTLPLLWRASPYNHTLSPTPCEAVLRDMRDWVNPKVSYAHDTMPVYDLPLSMRYDPKTTTGSSSVQYKDPIDRIGAFGLCIRGMLQLALVNPITHVHGDLISLDRLENSLGRNSGVVCRELDGYSIDVLSGGEDVAAICRNGHPHLASPARSPRMGHVPVPLLAHGPLPTTSAVPYERMVEIAWYIPGEMSPSTTDEQQMEDAM